MLAPKVTWNQAIRPPPTKESPLQEKNWEMQPLCLALGPFLKKRENHPELVFWQKEPLIVSSPDGYVPARFAVGEAREDPTAATTDWWAWKYPSSSSKYTLVLLALALLVATSTVATAATTTITKMASVGQQCALSNCVVLPCILYMYRMIFYGPGMHCYYRSDLQKLCKLLSCLVRVQSHCVSDPGWPLWQEWYIWALGQYCLIAEEVAAVFSKLL